MTAEPLDPDKLAEIRRVWGGKWYGGEAVDTLANEIDRLAAEVKTLRAAEQRVRELAEGPQSTLLPRQVIAALDGTA